MAGHRLYPGQPNPLTAQVSQPGELLRYVTDLLPNQLDGMGETG